MPENKQRLELTWHGKNDWENPEPRLLIKKETYLSAYEGRDDNLLIYGDNLLGLKALERDYTGKVKCIYIDPPYNTKSLFTHYKDNLEHSVWLNMMKERLIIMRDLLREDGSIWISIDGRECHYLKVMCDEIFGRENHLTFITVKVKDAAGVGQENNIMDVSEYILGYTKNIRLFKEKSEKIYQYKDIKEPVKGYNNLIKSYGKAKPVKTIRRKGVGKIEIYECIGYAIENPKKLSFAEYSKKYESIAADYNPGGGMIVAIKDHIPKKGLSYIEYVPTKGKDKGRKTKVYFKNRRILSFLSNISTKQNGKLKKRSKITNFWEESNSSLHLEGGVSFPNGKKPERLLQRIIHLATNPGDIVLDSFAGSGTTGAVAHKMDRRWIMIELGDHCHTHIIPRMKKVIDGEDAGEITKDVNWQGGGGFEYCELAPSLLEKNRLGRWSISKEYNPAMLSEAVCMHAGYRYDPKQDPYWIHGSATERDFIYVTPQTLPRSFLARLSSDVGENRSLMVYCAAFHVEGQEFDNLTVRKIPKTILKKCSWGRDDYQLKNALMEEAKSANCGTRKSKFKMKVGGNV